MENNKQNSQRLLRKPRAPKPHPPISPPPRSSDIVHDSNPQYAFYPDHNGFDTPTLSVSPPPPTESQSRPHSKVYIRSGHSTRKSQHRSHRKEDGRYLLDPAVRERTNLGTYVEGKSLVKAFRPRGPAALPFREPKHNPPLMLAYVDEDEMRYFKPPEFTLQDFTHKLSQKENVPIEKVQTIMFSKNTYKRIQKMLVEKCIPKHPELNTVQLDLEDDAVHTSPRIPHQQLLIEMAALVKEQMSSATNTDMRSLIRPLPRFSPDYKPNASHPHTEILLYEDLKGGRQRTQQQITQETELPGHDGFFHGPARHFQGSRRSHSPFVIEDEAFISPSELAVLDAIMSGGHALSLKANFISQMPDIEPLARTITYLNISFNDFKYIPIEVFDMLQLTVLKFRNNPIQEISPEIGKLRNLRTLVFSFCLVSALPIEMFELTHLEQLDMAYNRISDLPSAITKLTKLRELNVEGNELPALPGGVLKLLKLKYVRVRNNFMHPLFWKENTENQPQNLLHMAAQAVHKYKLPDHVITRILQYSECDLCHGPVYGSGLKAIRPVSKIFNIKNVPFLFRCCSTSCIQMLQGDSESLTELLYGVAA